MVPSQLLMALIGRSVPCGEVGVLGRLGNGLVTESAATPDLSTVKVSRVEGRARQS